MSAGRRKDPYRNFRFLIKIDGIVQAGFSEATIPDPTSDIIEYREGNEPTYVRKLPGLTKHGGLTLKWGITDSMEIHNWLSLIQQPSRSKLHQNRNRRAFQQTSQLH